MSDFLDPDSLRNRWSKEPFFQNSKVLSTRNPLSLIFAYMRCPVFVDIFDFQATMTTLDLSDLKLTRLDGIESLTNLAYLSVSRNKLSSLKKITELNCLTFLDASENIIAKIEALPESLSIIDLRSNAITSLGFCENLKLVAKLNISMNKIRSLKGIEKMKLLEMLFCADNQIKEKGNIDLLKNLSSLLLVDFSGNGLRDIVGYRQKILLNCPLLRSLDRERIPNEERIAATKSPGKALTAEFIDRWVPNLSAIRSLSFPNQRFEMVAFDDTILARIKHIEEVNLSKNRLQHFYELIRLENLRVLDLSENVITTISNEPTGDAEFGSSEPLLEWNHKWNTCKVGTAAVKVAEEAESFKELYDKVQERIKFTAIY
ncbi:unnamed protein product [Toxocara canis]|uniref:Protein phosphatase 1 regulatory subunit 7 n=1 Tax=Toxocara canis TaxID=6265 RepID=A0A3P7GZG1_TOXCA|nr:unnamed protein product [Toxocara canis]